MGTSVRWADEVGTPALPSGSAKASPPTTGWATWVRSGFDKLFALAALLFFLPVIALIALLLLVLEGRPLFFGHERIGKDGRTFRCLKFRTMATDANERLAALLASDAGARAEWEMHQKLDHDPRVTCLGVLLRKSSLDELPQFINVMRGDMALVGPRPIVATEAHHYGNHYPDYLSVKPGITGLWQVNGRSSTTYEERVALDMDYIHNRSFGRDLLILAKTVWVVFTRAGAA